MTAITRYYGALDGDTVRFCTKREEVEEGPPAPAAGNPFGYASVLLDGPVDWSARPSPLHSLRRAADGALTWEVLMDDLRDAKRIEINEAHELANKTSFTFMGKEIQANAHSMNQIQITNGGVLLRGALHPNWQGAWKTLDNEYVLIPDVATWKAFYDAIETTGQSNFAKAQALKAQLASATTPEQVAAITWSAA